MSGGKILKIGAVVAVILASVAARNLEAQTAPARGFDQAPSAAVNQSAASLAVTDPTLAKLSDLGWLEGRWRGEWGPRMAEQVWFSPKAGAMEGMFRVIEGDKTLVIEYFTLVQKPDGIALYIRHFTPTLAAWEKSDATVLNLATTDGKKFEFQNAVNGMPKVSSLTKVDADTYVAHSEIVPETGEPQIVEISYKRQPAAGAGTSGGSGARPKKP
ncbi:MAG TPA: DUF6265 family protein [Candidatus Acidoferrales bacterium]